MRPSRPRVHVFAPRTCWITPSFVSPGLRVIITNNPTLIEDKTEHVLNRSTHESTRREFLEMQLTMYKG